ncbi:MAG: hypothetical protein ACI9G1_000218 [Pirellulaceae bacterium]|jgi:hypothetical protein
MVCFGEAGYLCFGLSERQNRRDNINQSGRNERTAQAYYAPQWLLK